MNRAVPALDEAPRDRSRRLLPSTYTTLDGLTNRNGAVPNA
jgi:hypothetical protein